MAGNDARTLLDHLLNSTRRVDLHCRQVIKSVHFRRVFAELLAERIGQVVGGIRGLISFSTKPS